ncbi:C4-dicarboxylate TRAP transporter substrate-binding protein [Terasakiella pusilla]|uniref:C4-dicarboxylate TRAP transporter substrate-binding protein n=1 Tax=Terasakiella pusilla TaxID=64973 RepID=UPI003AA8EDCA
MKKSMIKYAGIAALTLAAVSSTVPASATTLISGQSTSGRGPFGAGIEWFNDEVKKRTDNAVDFDIQWGGALFKAPAARQSIADGIADLGIVIGAYTPREMVAYSISDLPVMGADPWVSMKATQEFMTTEPSIKQQLAEQNLVYLGTYTTSAIQLICKGDPVTTIEDIKGKKIRGIGVYGKTFKELGANLVSMSYYQSYQALDTGLLDCTQGYSYATKSLKHYEVTDSITLLNWGQLGALGMFMNKDTFDSLPENVQKALLEVGNEVPDYYGQRMNHENDTALKDMKEGINGKSIDVLSFDPEDLKKVKKAGEKYISDWVKNANEAGLEGERMLERVKSLVAKYEKQRDEEGYPWAKK